MVSQRFSPEGSNPSVYEPTVFGEFGENHVTELPEVSPTVYQTLSESGATCAQARPLQNRRRTRHGSLGWGVLIICDCPGSMMGNKWSVISHQGPHHHQTSSLTPQSSRASRPSRSAGPTWQNVRSGADVDKWTGKCSLAKMQRTSLSGTRRHGSR